MSDYITKQNTMKWFYFESDRGCGIHEDKDIECATENLCFEVGHEFLRLVREATEEDVDWVNAMGGYIPETNNPFKK